MFSIVDQSSNNDNVKEKPKKYISQVEEKQSLSKDLAKDIHYDELYDTDEDECKLVTVPPIATGCSPLAVGSLQSHGSVITYLLSQLKIGMDLTKITLPTFILEKRSTLEMYGDFLAHANLWAEIPRQQTPRDRFLSCLRWYLSAFHAGRKTSVAKKPYNPILGEIFRCYWHVSDSSVQDAPVSATGTGEAAAHGANANNDTQSGQFSWAPCDSVVFIAEQVIFFGIAC